MWIVVITLLAALAAELLRCRHFLQICEEDIPIDSLPEEWDGMRILHLSDLHGCRYGRRNRRLAHRIAEIQPDVIVCSGDMMEKTRHGDRAFLQLLEELAGRFPVFYSLGNHELYLEEEDGRAERLSRCMERGAVVLDNRMAAVEYKGQAFKIGGYCAPVQSRAAGKKCGHCRLTAAQIGDLRGKIGEGQREGFTMLLAHDPDGFPVYARWGADLVLSGHIHGGLWRPFGIALLSPTRRPFPRYAAGVYRENQSVMFVSRGLAGAGLPRLFNRPELAVLTLRQKER